MNVLLFANIGTNVHGFYHVGDEAMFLEIYRFYKKRFPKINISALVNDKLHDQLDLNEVKLLPWPLNKRESRWYFFKLLLKTYYWKFFKHSIFNYEEQKLIKLVKKQDIIHYSGGGNINSEVGHWTYLSLMAASLANILDIPVILTSQTIGPFNLSDWILALFVLRKAKILTLREYTSKTQKRLQRILRSVDINSSLDAAYFFDSTYKIIPKKANTLRIGLSLHVKANNQQQIIDLIANTLNNLCGEYKTIEIVLLPHVLDRKQGWDMIIMSSLIKNLSKKILVLNPDYHSLSKGKYEIAHIIKSYTKSCDLVISTRYHGLLFAISSAIPAIAVTDGEYQTMKSSEGLKFAFKQKYADHLVKLDSRDSVNNLLKTIGSTITNAAAIHIELEKVNKLLRKQHEEYLDNLEEQIRILQKA